MHKIFDCSANIAYIYSVVSNEATSKNKIIMKNSIATLLDSYVFDNSDSIKENGGNAAEYILLDAEAMDQGWLWFLSDEEIEEFENDSKRANELIKEIKDYVNSKYNYEVE